MVWSQSNFLDLVFESSTEPLFIHPYLLNSTLKDISYNGTQWWHAWGSNNYNISSSNFIVSFRYS